MKKLFIALILWPVLLLADPPHHSHEDTITVIVDQEYGQTRYQEECVGAALSIAKAQHQMDLSTRDLQGSLGLGHFKDCTGISFMAGQRLTNGLLINGSIGSEDGEVGIGAGLRWNF